MTPTPDPESPPRAKGHPFVGGIVAGLVGGVVLSIALVATTIAHGGDVWMTLKGAGTPLLHDRAIQPGFDRDAVLIGLGCHFGVSIIWGLLFSALFYGLPKSVTAVLGLVWGIVVWVAMYYLVLPLVGLGAMARSAPVGPVVILHLAFGLALGLAFLPFQRVQAVPPQRRTRGTRVAV